MADMAVPNEKPGPCEKCRGSGIFTWGGTINGQPRFSGQCNSCAGKGHQTLSDIRRNETYNRHKIISI
jgi:DnaJ-class molecular chaperone